MNHLTILGFVISEIFSLIFLVRNIGYNFITHTHLWWLYLNLLSGPDALQKGPN